MTYGVILIDPPWRFINYSNKNQSRAVPYDTMTLEEIAAMNVMQYAADDCALFMWVVDSMLDEAISIGKGWGFTYVKVGFNWMKITMDGGDLRMITGYTTRNTSELCLLFKRGNPKRLNADVRQGILAPPGEHSEKPWEIHQRIERLYPGPYLEIFGRRQRGGWDVVGNQSDLFEPLLF